MSSDNGKDEVPSALKLYEVLYKTWGPQDWWPSKSDLETILGVILVQNTAWTNAKKAIVNLKAHDTLEWNRLALASEEELAQWIQPAGTFRVKARRIKNFIHFVNHSHQGDLRTFLQLPCEQLRHTLLSINGLGPESADCIVLYAAHHPAFVVDAYTRRFLSRHGWILPKATYDQIAQWFTRQLPPDPPLFNEYHALLVKLGKIHCRAKPLCEQCPLNKWLPETGPRKL